MRNRIVQPPAQPCLAVLLVGSSAGLVLQRFLGSGRFETNPPERQCHYDPMNMLLFRSARL